MSLRDDNLDRNFSYLTHDVARLLRKVYDRRFKDLGLTRSQWFVLSRLYVNEGITQSQLADLLELKKPTIARLLDRLEISGWVERRADPNDRRAKRLYLTDKVLPVVEKMSRIAGQTRRDALAGLPPDQHERLIDALLTIRTNLLVLDAEETVKYANRRRAAE